MDFSPIDAGAGVGPEPERAPGSPDASRLGHLPELVARLLAADRPSSVYIVPDVPQKLMLAASQQFLSLQPGEILMAVVGRSDRQQVLPECALTNLGIHSPQQRAKGTADGFNPTHRPGFLAYEDVPSTIPVKGVLVRRIEVGASRPIQFPTKRKAADFVASFLSDARSIVRGESTAAVAALAKPSTASEFRTASMVEFSHRLHPELVELRSFAQRVVATNRSVVVPLIILACVGVYAWMCAQGLSPFQPSIEGLIHSGASFGPSIVADHEYWRLFTAMFVHIGLVHLLMNMVALGAAGRLVEKLFGSVSFLLLYVLSGVGGSLASLAHEPLMVSAGASGAIFGVFGGLIAFLLIRRSDFPNVILVQQLKGLGTFLAMNLVLGLGVPNIDMAAHVGGLVTGFLLGGALAMSSKATTAKRVGLRWVTAVGFIGLLFAGWVAVDRRAQANLSARPEFRAFKAEPAWNSFSQGISPSLAEFDGIERELNQILSDGFIRASELPALTELQAKLGKVGKDLAAVAVADPDLEPIRSALTTVVEKQGSAIERLILFTKSNQAKEMTGPGGFEDLMRAKGQAVNSFQSLKTDYFRKNGLKDLSSGN